MAVEQKVVIKVEIDPDLGKSAAINTFLTQLDRKTKRTSSTLRVFDAGFKKLQDDFDALEYSRKRAQEYPKIKDQLDLIYHSGIDAWKAKIKETKDKYPKPS